MHQFRIACFLLFFATQLSAQITLSPILGMNLNRYVWNNNGVQLSAENWRPGYNAGLSLYVPVSHRFALESSLQYVRLYTEPAKNQISQIKYRFDRLDLQEALTYDLIKHVSIFAGLGYSIRLAESVRAAYTGSDWKKPIVDLSEKGVFQAVAGFNLVFGPLFLRAQFNQAISSAIKVDVTDDNGQPNGIAKARNQTLLWSVGYKCKI
ncbi:MAG: outer membrane beta-barrel protein [Bacteroidetes bacterium]|nr:outer membrane beta-barrel protein [Bacteroidota bacterium]